MPAAPGALCFRVTVRQPDRYRQPIVVATSPDEAAAKARRVFPGEVRDITPLHPATHYTWRHT